MDVAAIGDYGLEVGRRPVWVSRDLEVAREAIGGRPGGGSGIVEARIPRDEFERVMAAGERPYCGFESAREASSEIVLRTAEQVEVFNRYRVGRL